MKRGRFRKSESELVALWIPRELLAVMDLEVRRTDTDRSKLLRNALREKLTRAGVQLKEAA